MPWKKTKGGYVQADDGDLSIAIVASKKWRRHDEKSKADRTLTKKDIAKIKAEREERTRQLRESLKSED